MRPSITIVEVGPRDGFQPIGPFIPTERKFDFLRRLVGCGLRDIEIGSFVNPRAVLQLADTPELLGRARAHLPTLRPRVLVPSLGQARRALAAEAPFLAFVLSVSESHNRSNVRRSPAESVEEYRELVDELPAGTDMRLNLATSFDCPYDGRIAADAVMRLLEPLITALPRAEICLCDTTGRADPAQVAGHFAAVMAAFGPGLRWSFHGHDTYGLGAANVYAAWGQGVRVFDAAIAGLGGCPFAPGATGNVATEDLVNMFCGMGVDTGCDLAALAGLAEEAAALQGAQPGGRVRQALAARRRLETT